MDKNMSEQALMERLATIENLAEDERCQVLDKIQDDMDRVFGEDNSLSNEFVISLEPGIIEGVLIDVPSNKARNDNYSLRFDFKRGQKGNNFAHTAHTAHTAQVRGKINSHISKTLPRRLP